MCSLDFYKPRHFEAHELLPPREYAQWGEFGLLYFMDVRVLITLDQVRDFFGAPVTVNNYHWGGRLRYRGYRPDSYYDRAGESPYKSGSQHRFGRAADLDIRGVTATEARDVVLNHQDHFPHIRRIEDGVRWVHFDVANVHHHGIHLFYPDAPETGK